MTRRTVRSGLLVVAAVTVISFALTGCATKPHGLYAPPSEASRNPIEADRLNREAADLMLKDAAKAETRLREALTQDLYCGPAHNNLGVLYLNRGELYEAANEFEWARKLLPGNPDPPMNLAMALEHAGRTDEAITNYRAALDVRSEYIPAMQALTRLQLRSGKADDKTNEYLKEIALKGETPLWREWAKEWIMKRGD